jgi:hypothetical protein
MHTVIPFGVGNSNQSLFETSVTVFNELATTKVMVRYLGLLK